jgi:hypothetical protein
LFNAQLGWRKADELGPTYLGIWFDWLAGLDAGAGAFGEPVAAGAAGVAGTGDAGDDEPAGAGTDDAGNLSITPPLPASGRLPMKANARVAPKNIAAATPVDLDKKFEDPVAPNKLPDAPEPKEAPMSAPLPCCSNTRPMIVKADRTWTIMMNVCIVFIF